MENEALLVDEMLSIAEMIGYGNSIAHIKKAWAESLIRKWGIPPDHALRATEVGAYPLDKNLQPRQPDDEAVAGTA